MHTYQLIKRNQIEVGQVIFVLHLDGMRTYQINRVTDAKFRAGTMWFYLDGTRAGDDLRAYVQGDLLAEIMDAPVTYKPIDATTSYVGMSVYLKYVDSDDYQAGTITRKDPGLTAEINGRKYITNKNGWGGHHSYQVFIT